MAARGGGSRWTWLSAALLGTSTATCIFAPESTPGGCADAPGSCDDGNACTQDACAEDGYCAHVPVASLLDDATLGDCKRPGCDAQGGIVDVPDDTDLPPDDGVPCTLGRCSNGVAEYVLEEGASCGSPGCGGADPDFSTTSPGTCQTGGCVQPAAVPCGLYRCNAEGTACRIDCSVHEDCTFTAYCTGGACVLDLDNGQGCDSDAQCTSGFCRDGYCCDGPCDGLCQSCNEIDSVGPNGVCSNIEDKSDPASECRGSCDIFNGWGCCNESGGCY
jgi:hypothetical protein